MSRAPVNELGALIQVPTWENTDGMSPKWEGFLYEAVAGNQNTFDELVTTERKLRGGWYEIITGAPVTYGDYIEFSIVDKDDTLGLFATYGLTVGVHVLELKKYVITDYINPGLTGVREQFIVNGSFTVVPGLYFRTIYHSVGIQNVKFKTVMFFYED